MRKNKKQIELSILMPVYQNEKIEHYIKNIHDKIIKKLRLGNIEIIVAEDGSKDNTKNILKRIKSKYNLILNLCEHQRGYINAVKEIYMQAQGKYIFFTDSDGEHSASDFWKLWKKLHNENLDLVVGFKMNRKPFYRMLISKIHNLLLGILFNIWLKDANCGFRLMKNEVAKKIIPLTGNLTVAYNAETLIFAKKMNYKYGEVPTKHFYQKSTALTLKNIPLKLCNALFDLFKLKFKIVTKQ